MKLPQQINSLQLWDSVHRTLCTLHVVPYGSSIVYFDISNYTCTYNYMYTCKCTSDIIECKVDSQATCRWGDTGLNKYNALMSWYGTDNFSTGRMWALWLLEMPPNATTVWCCDYSSPFSLHSLCIPRIPHGSSTLKKMHSSWEIKADGRLLNACRD